MGWRLLVTGLVAFGFCETESASGADSPRMLGGVNRPFSVQDIPAGRFRDELSSLSAKALDRASEHLRGFEFPVEDSASLHADSDGGIFYSCDVPAAPTSDGSKETQSTPGLLGTSIAVSPFPSSLIFHTRPGSSNVIFLDFDGHVVTNTAWNNSLGRTQIIARAFSIDSDATTYNDSEQEMIRRIWQRVKEDYAPFDVDVTTEEPSPFHLRVARVLITRNTDVNGNPNPSSTAGGVAYINFFGKTLNPYYSPAWVYPNNLSSIEENIGEAASHEAGHNLGLSHDGVIGATYYYGHGTNETSWAPIMGAAYGKSISQWSKGEYLQANNLQDDLAIISDKLNYLPDDGGDSLNDAKPLYLYSNTDVRATTPLTDPQNMKPENKGVIDPNDPADFWIFAAGNGTISLHINPWIGPGLTRGNNIDIKATLLDSNGVALATSNPTGETAAALSASVTTGIYYLKVEATSFGSPTNSQPSGFTKYGSCGQYFVTGSVPAAADIIIEPDPPAALGVDLSPFEAATQGAGWRVLNLPDTNWQSSGFVMHGATAGMYTVTFKPLIGWTQPADQQVALAPGITNSVNAAYTPLTTKNHNIPYWWLIQNGYTNNFETVIAGTGANGFTLWESYIAGLDPNDPTSVVEVEILSSGDGNDMVVTWTPVQGRMYSVYFQNEPGQPPQPVPDAQNMTWPRSSYTNDATTATSGMLQLRVTMP